MGAPVSTSKRVTGASSIRSPVYWALLGLVMDRPGYVYELLKRFERVYGDLLNLSSNSHIYTAIDVLKDRRLIEEVPGEAPSGHGRQPKPRYRATASGVESYREWLLVQLDEGRRRWQLSVRQLAAIAHEPDAALAIIESYGQACLGELGTSTRGSIDGERMGSAPCLAERLQAEGNRLELEAGLRWVEYARREFRAVAQGAHAS